VPTVRIERDTWDFALERPNQLSQMSQVMPQHHQIVEFWAGTWAGLSQGGCPSEASACGNLENLADQPCLACIEVRVAAAFVSLNRHTRIRR
jgi:hypothetical protein